MRHFVSLILVLSFTAACSVSIEPIPEPTPSRTAAPTGTNTPLPTGTFESFARTPDPDDYPPTRMNFLLLGGDYRAHRRGTGYGNKTDVIVLVSILDTLPVKITMIQYPRNLYLPLEGLEDQWLFGVYDRENTYGLYYYFQEAFDVDLHGIFFVNMDGFVKLIDDLGGVGEMTGDQTLAYLRDNDNNWNRGSYDAEERVFKVLLWMADLVGESLAANPLVTAGVLFDRWHGLVTTDIATIDQLAQIARVAYNAYPGNWELRLAQLEEPAIVRGDTPLSTRGMIAVEDLIEWHSEVLEW